MTFKQDILMNKYLIYKDSRYFFTLITREIEYNSDVFELIETNENLGDFYINKWDGSKFVEGASAEEIKLFNGNVVPVKVTNAQFRLELINRGISISGILDYIKLMSDISVKERLLTLFEYANFFERNNVLLIQMANELNISEEELDQIFINAEKL